MRLAVGLCAVFVGASPFFAQECFAQEIIAGKTITILVGFAAGQSPDMAANNEGADSAGQRLTSEPTYDQAARLYAAHLGRFLPGKPNVEFKLVPGAASLVAARQMTARPASDGAVIAMLGPAPIMGTLTGNAGGFDPGALAWIGARQRDDDVCLARAGASVRSLDDATQRETFAAALAPGSKSWTYPRALNALAGTKFKIISGYSSAFEVTRALETGETDAWCGWSIGALRLRHPDLLREGKVNLLAQFSRAEASARMQVPNAEDLPVQPAAREAMSAIASQTRFAAFALAAPATTEPARLRLLRTAFLEMLRSPEFLADAARVGAEVDPVSGEEMQSEAARVLSASPTARGILRGIFRGL